MVKKLNGKNMCLKAVIEYAERGPQKAELLGEYMRNTHDRVLKAGPETLHAKTGSMKPLLTFVAFHKTVSMAQAMTEFVTERSVNALGIDDIFFSVMKIDPAVALGTLTGIGMSMAIDLREALGSDHDGVPAEELTRMFPEGGCTCGEKNKAKAKEKYTDEDFIRDMTGEKKPDGQWEH